MPRPRSPTPYQRWPMAFEVGETMPGRQQPDGCRWMQVPSKSFGRVIADRAAVDWVVSDRLILIALSRSITHFGSANEVDENAARSVNVRMILLMIISFVCGSIMQVRCERTSRE